MLRISKFTNKKCLEFYQRWLEYIPDAWEVEVLLNKKASDLSDIELDRLKIISEGKKTSAILQKYIDKINNDKEHSNDLCQLILFSEENLELENIEKSFDLDQIALVKLSENELQEINRIIDLFDGTNNDEILQKIAKIESIYVRDYADYLFKFKVVDFYSKNSDKKKKNYYVYKLKHRKNSNRRKKY